MNILALDLGEHTGYAALIYGQIRSGVEHWKHRTNESAGMKYLRGIPKTRGIDSPRVFRTCRIGATVLLHFAKID